MSYPESRIGQQYRERIPVDKNTRERPSAHTMAKDTVSNQQEKRYRSIFDVPANFFDACRVVSDTFEDSENWVNVETLEVVETNVKEEKSSGSAPPRWTCNTCKSEFETLLDQRFHFKSDIHRINVKLSIAGKDAVKEEDFDELTCDSFKDFDISSISGSEDEAEKAGHRIKCSVDNVKQKLFIRLKTGERISVWKCLFLNEYESVSSQAISADYGGLTQCLSESEVVERLKFFINEPRGNSHLRVMLLVSGGHFAGCVFDGNSVVAHKTFHRYVVRAKAGKKQSSKDSSGRAAHSAGASLRRYNELALKKDIQELLSTWKDYFCASSCVFVYAPSNNYQMLFDGGKEHFSQRCVVRNIPLNVRRPTYKEARRIYSQLTQVTYEVDQKENVSDIKEDTVASVSSIIDGSPYSSKEEPVDNFNCRETTGASQGHQQSIEACVSSESDSEVVGVNSEVVGVTTPLHEAAQSADADKVLEHLEQGLDPCVKDERGRTPYMLANDKEVRNTFRRFMAANLNRWDWHAAKVPSALTKEMEESHAAKQAEKDAKKKARAKELKKLRKAREKKAQDEAATSRASTAIVKNQATSSSMFQGQSKPRGSEESIEVEREKRAAAAERRTAASAMAVLNTQSTGTAATLGLQPLSGSATDLLCTCCGTSLAGKVPFHRYNYKYCSTTCMHVHREFLEDGG